MHQNVFNLICLLDLDTNAHTVDAGLNQDPLVLVSRYGEGVQQNFGGGLGFDFRDIVSFGGLRCEIREAEGGG